MIQALMYIGTFLLTYVWTIILAIQIPKNASEPGLIDALTFSVTFFVPLQGLFNAIIFIYQKVHTLRRTNADITVFGAFKQAILAPSTVPQQVVSSIEIAKDDIEVRRKETTRMYRGQTSLSQREWIKANSFGLRRSGSNALIQIISNDDDSPDYIESNGGGGSSSRCLSSPLSLGDILDPYDDDEFMSMMERIEGVVPSDSPPLPNEEDSSFVNSSVDMLSWSPDLCSIIPEEHEEEGHDGIGLDSFPT